MLCVYVLSNGCKLFSTYVTWTAGLFSAYSRKNLISGMSRSANHKAYYMDK